MNCPSGFAAPPTARIIRSRIVEWDHARGFGYAETGGRKVFVHHREFTRKPRPPRKGDRISFVLGADERGRPCARAIEALGGEGYLRPRHFLALAALLVPPALVVAKLPWSPWISAGAIGLLSWLTWEEYRRDKALARASSRRVPERVLQTLSFAGGWPGAFLAQRRFRHKTAKHSFQRVFWTIILIHEAAAIDFLLGGPGCRYLLEVGRELLSRLPA
jgi:uncharacterized membrane protein YsdA (DUF1294 family)/cold shock CspA family protein